MQSSFADFYNTLSVRNTAAKLLLQSVANFFISLPTLPQLGPHRTVSFRAKFSRRQILAAPNFRDVQEKQNLKICICSLPVEIVLDAHREPILRPLHIHSTTTLMLMHEGFRGDFFLKRLQKFLCLQNVGTRLSSRLGTDCPQKPTEVNAFVAKFTS
jgi:hypothetical protein